MLFCLSTCESAISNLNHGSSSLSFRLDHNTPNWLLKLIRSSSSMIGISNILVHQDEIMKHYIDALKKNLNRLSFNDVRSTEDSNDV